MKFSIWPNLQQPWNDVLEIACHAEGTGWDGVWLADHFMGDGGGFGAVETPTLECTAALAALATATERVRLGSLVFGMTYRHPAVLANWAASVDHISGGRLTLGIGAGWQENEHDQYGIELPGLRDRIDRFGESVAAVSGLLNDSTTSLDGRWFQLTDAVCEPKPLQIPLPILVGGKGNRMMKHVARYANAWNMWGMPGEVAERSAALDRACAAIDRDPAEIARSCQALIMITDNADKAAGLVNAVAPRAAVAGTVDHVAETVAGWQEIGVDEVIVPDFVLGRGARRLEAMDALIETLAPGFN